MPEPENPVCSASGKVRGKQFVVQQEQKILKLRPRDTENTEKKILGFHIRSLVETDKDKVGNLWCCSLSLTAVVHLFFDFSSVLHLSKFTCHKYLNNLY